MSIIGNPILTGGLTPKLIEREIDGSGLYIASTEGADGFSRVRVTAGGGGGGSGAVVMEKSDWDALSIQEKGAYDYVGIIERDSGVLRGILVYGAEYQNSWLLATPGTIIAETDFTRQLGDGVWGNSVHFEGATKNLDNTVNTNATSSTTTIPIYVELANRDASFTAYIVSKYVGGGNRMLMSFGYNDSSVSGGMGLLWNGSLGATLSLWGNDTGISAPYPWKYEGFIAAALAYNANTQMSWGYVLNENKSALYSLSKSRGARNSSHIIVGKTFPLHATPTNDARTNTNVAYLSVTDAFDGENNILENLVNIVNMVEDNYVKPV